jgi:hypothetical protein
MEACCVCFCPGAKALAPCGHSMCCACLDRWLAKAKVSCPVCRGVLVAHPAPAPSAARVVWIDYASPDPAQREHVGITLATCVGGVRVRSMHPHDRAKTCGVRVGDTFSHLNGIRVCDHETAVAIVDRAAECKVNVACRVSEPPPRTVWARWARRRRTRTRAPAGAAAVLVRMSG